MDVPRIRYEFLTRRVGTTPPVADAGPPQIGVAAGIITLNGSGSHDPLGEALTFSWKQIGGPSVSLSGANTATPTFTAAASQTYAFQLTVTNTDGLSASATTSVQTLAATVLTISQFYANPATVNAGQSTTLLWVLQGASSASIAPGIGSINPELRLGFGLARPNHHLHVDRYRLRRKHRYPGGNHYRGRTGFAADCPLHGRSQYHCRRQFGDPELVYQ